jgi:hypothetical protein
MTMMSAAMMPQPPIQPVRGPNARAAPRERGAAVGLGLVQLAVGHGDEIHRDEGQQHDRGRLLPAITTISPRLAARL